MAIYWSFRRVISRALQADERTQNTAPADVAVEAVRRDGGDDLCPGFVGVELAKYNPSASRGGGKLVRGMDLGPWFDGGVGIAEGR